MFFEWGILCAVKLKQNLFEFTLLTLLNGLHVCKYTDRPTLGINVSRRGLYYIILYYIKRITCERDNSKTVNRSVNSFDQYTCGSLRYFVTDRRRRLPENEVT